ncbi:hypothetical protein QEZ54_35610 [Catellatospora sp. KI3]|uniref:hypothetical protein n=1 Tax=Catellatospora sp. KI3 TaxID=3041620 RepID=UPI0024832E59|nr:hypothetical protein [Catellatospora sp. KI3]MDI1466319.1 hypothetical protein [Catellatospora sp. KI3]
MTGGVDSVDLLGLIRMAASDYDSMDRLEAVLLPAEGGVHPQAPMLVAPIVAYAGDPAALLPDQLLRLLVDVVTHEGGAAAREQLRFFAVNLRALSDVDDYWVAETATCLLGFCGPDPALAATLRERADEELDLYRRVTPLVAAARLDPAAAATWLPALLQPEQPATVRVAAVLALREAGLAPDAAAQAALAQGWAADPEALRWATLRASLRGLLAYAVGGDPGRTAAVLTAIARTGTEQARCDVVDAVAALPEPLPAAVADLVTVLLDDEGERVRKRAYALVADDDTLTLRHADWLVQAIERGRNRRSALGALIRVGDKRWQDWAVESLRGGWTPHNLPEALATLPPDPAVHEAMLARVVHLATAIDVRQAAQSAARQRELRGLLDLLPPRLTVAPLARHLPQMTFPARLWIANHLAYAGTGDPAVIAAIASIANGEVTYLRLLWLAGGDVEPLRDALAVAPRLDVLAAVVAAEVFGDGDPDVAQRLREIRDSGADIRDRFAAAGALWELTSDAAEVAGTVREALGARSRRTREEAADLAAQIGLDQVG